MCRKMKKGWLIAGIIVIIAVAGLLFVLPKAIDKIMAGGPAREQQRGGPSCSVQPGEWVPEQGDCPGETVQMQDKCAEFCNAHPDCCGDEGREPGKSNLFELPSQEEISKLTRNYPATIKCINEGPALYSQGKFEIISDETFSKMKDTGFNTIQVLTMNDCTGDKCVMDEEAKSLLLNDIVKAKEAGLAVWLAVEFINAPPGSSIKLPEYAKFKSSFIDYSREIGELAEEYKIEYVTVNNEPDLFLQEQTQWGSVDKINEYVAEMMPLANSAVKEKFTGKIINKITQTKKRPQEVLDASFKNVDIAGVDVGPPIEDGSITLAGYQADFTEYQYYASLAKKAGVPWMNGEYWQYNFMEEPSDYVKENQLEYAKVSFDAYLKATPKGVGYTWNDFSTFSQPNGEETRQAIKEFLDKI